MAGGESWSQVKASLDSFLRTLRAPGAEAGYSEQVDETILAFNARCYREGSSWFSDFADTEAFAALSSKVDKLAYVRLLAALVQPPSAAVSNSALLSPGSSHARPLCARRNEPLAHPHLF